MAICVCSAIGRRTVSKGLSTARPLMGPLQGLCRWTSRHCVRAKKSRQPVGDGENPFTVNARMSCTQRLICPFLPFLLGPTQWPCATDSGPLCELCPWTASPRAPRGGRPGLVERQPINDQDARPNPPRDAVARVCVASRWPSCLCAVWRRRHTVTPPVRLPVTRLDGAREGDCEF